MPRHRRIDFVGAFHHVIIRGIGRGLIFREDSDRKVFLGRLALLLEETDTKCPAWVLMPNHAHFLFRTGRDTLGKLMQRLLLSYAQWFNRKNGRIGHLFHNRYKAILCEEEPYFLELVRYIHLNPLRGGLVQDYGELERFPWGGHRTLLGKVRLDWQDVDGVLAVFGNKRRKAREAYDQFVRAGENMGRRDDLMGGGLLRSVGGMEGIRSIRRDKMLVRGDERILGSGEFVARVLMEREQVDRRREGIRKRISPAAAVAKAAAIFGVAETGIHRNGKRPTEARARALACKWLVEDMGLPGVEVATLLGITPPAVCRCVIRGKKIEAEMRLGLLD